jgi:DNA modification methylase
MAEQMIETVSIDELEPHPANPRQGDVGLIHSLIEENGWYGVIVAQRSSGRILAGNHRWRAAKAAGLEELPVAYLDVDDDRAERILLADNRSNDLASYDDHALADLLQLLTATEPGLLGTGYDGDDLDQLLADLNREPLRQPDPGADPSKADELQEKWQTELGQVWQVGDHRLVCSDARDTAMLNLLLGDESARMVMADPPYNVGYTGGSGNPHARSDSYDDDRADYAAWLAEILNQANHASDTEAALHLWFAASKIRDITTAVDTSGWEDRALIIWSKQNPHYGALGSQYKLAHEPMLYCHKRGASPRWYGATNEKTIWEYPQQSVNDLHPTMKPVAAYERSIKNHTQPGDTVLECFTGSGTTLVACQQTSRKGRGVEISPGYVAVTLERLTGMGLTPEKTDG